MDPGDFHGESGMSRQSYCQHRIQWIGLGEIYRISNNVFPMKNQDAGSEMSILS